ncbi:amidohydrolase [Roseovarius sp. EL26]|uniref:amidohydrolase n=1 Tax=Roseovarius sp. EL26 TaxID=2126672 RepID=UPI000EA1F516|nr:amidohydrolase [Roseovarius sp. EL26]
MPSPDLIIINAQLLTMNSNRPRAQAIAITRGKITEVGSDDQIRSLMTPNTEVIDAKGGTVLPGFIDSHVHLFQGSAELDFLPVGGKTHLSEIRQDVLDYATARPDEPLVLGTGAFYDLFIGVDKDPRNLLDEILPDRPFALLGADLHTVWANTAALGKAGLLNGADMPEGSTVVMGDDGLANGILHETGAFGPVLALSRTGGRDMLGYVTGADPIPPATPEERAADKALLLKGLDHCAAHGITTLHNMDGNNYQLELLSELEKEGKLKCRVQVPFHLKNFDPIERLDEAAEMHRKYSSDMVWSGRVKMFMDGVFESRTALVTRPFPDAPESIGEAAFEPDHFNAACIKVDAMGLQLSTHAVGDLAVRRVIDGYEAAAKANGTRDARHRVEHIELITDQDIPRLKELAIVASMQPRHAPFAGFFEPVEPDTTLFSHEYGHCCPWRRIRDAGIALTFSTDWPVVPVDVMANIQCAVTPLDLGDDWMDQSQTLMETLESYTAKNAWLGFKENQQGKLAPGYDADIVMLKGDIETTQPNDLGGLGIAMTICAGRITYDIRH